MGPFFFFQAEDGIRDRNVTGVQTCALPISIRQLELPIVLLFNRSRVMAVAQGVSKATGLGAALDMLRASRSEERRVGKECRGWRSPCHSKNNHDCGES